MCTPSHAFLSSPDENGFREPFNVVILFKAKGNFKRRFASLSPQSCDAETLERKNEMFVAFLRRMADAKQQHHIHERPASTSAAEDDMKKSDILTRAKNSFLSSFKVMIFGAYIGDLNWCKIISLHKDSVVPFL